MIKTGNGREPLLRTVKRNEFPFSQQALLYVGAIVFALFVGALFILALKINPFSFYKTIVSGCFRSNIAMRATVKIIIPLLLNSLGVVLAFKMKFWNIGAEGQMIMGAIFATYFGLHFSSLPHYLLITIMFLAGIVGGGIWGFIPALFKCIFGTNETLLTLMLNYIALYIIVYLASGPWDYDADGFLSVSRLPKSARLDTLFGVHIGWVIAIAVLIFIFIYMKYSKHGYEISVVGESENTARYAGMNVKLIVIRTMVISGAICGIAGMTQISGEAFTLDVGIAGGVGFTAIIVAWLARLNPVGILLVSSLFGILEKGCGVVQSEYNISSSVSDILQGVILFCILVFDFFIRYRLVFRRRAD